MTVTARYMALGIRHLAFSSKVNETVDSHDALQPRPVDPSGKTG